jgi:hypothetical protein
MTLSAEKVNKATKYTITMSVPIPKDVELGDDKVTISVGNGFELADKRDVEKMDLKEMTTYFNNLLKPGLFLAVRYIVEKKENVNEAPEDKVVIFRNLRSTPVKKIVSSKSKKIIYAVPLPAVLGFQTEFKGVKEKNISVEKKKKEVKVEAKKQAVKKNDGKKNGVPPPAAADFLP